MKHIVRRCLALLIVLALCVSLLPGISLTADAATVSYRKTSDGKVYNWGVRGTTATFLSPNAEEFYDDNNVTYAQLASLSGSSSTGGVPESALYKRLQTLMKSNHSHTTGYDETRSLYQYTDCQNNAYTSTKISSFYSGKAIGPGWDSGSTWNREHTWPDSKGLEGKDEDDIMMLRPTSVSENSGRGNTAYGEGGSYYDPNEQSKGVYNLHGDVARIMLYQYVRWGNTSYMWDTSGVMESKAVLLKWMEEDPVDTWELGRNDSVESITGTRNVFVDYPELAFVLFDEEIPENYVTPSGQATASAYSITAVSNNTSYGSVSVSGKTITAFPNTGYEVDGYTVTAGTATVTREGNAFTVSASSDCTVRINFKARIAAYGQFYENGAATTKLSSYIGDDITVPDAVNEAPDGFTFLGWVTATVEETSTRPAILSVGSKYTMETTTSFYGLYSRTVEDTTGTSNLFELYTGPISAGDYVLTFNYGAMQASVSSNRLQYASVIPVDDAILSPAADLIWTLKKTADGYYTLYNASAKGYAGATGTANQAGILSAVTNYAKWTVSGTKTYDFANLGNQSKAINHTLRRNNNFGFACYSSSTGGALTLYKRASATVLYSTVAAACTHENLEVVDAVAPSCETVGYTEGLFCKDCSNYVLGHEVQEALGHDYKSVVTKPTATQQGYTTHSCVRCGHSYVDSYTEALGPTYTVSFAVPTGVAPVKPMSCNSSGITLPEAGTLSDEYTFIGWAAGSLADTKVAPTLYTGKYVATGDSTLYAVYSYSTNGSGAWVKVTSTSQLSAGAQVVIASSEKGFVAGNISSQVMTNLTATFSSDKSTIGSLPANAAVLTLGGRSGAWTFANQNGQLLGATAAKKLAWNNGTTTWTISISGGNATIQNSTSSFGRFLYNVNSPRFTTYTSDTNVSMLLPQLYVQNGATYYTTLDGKVESVEKVGDGEGTYASLKDAIAETGSEYLFLMEDLTEDVVIDSDIILDLNGKTLTGDITIVEGARLRLFDSATADYTADSRGRIVGGITGDLARTMNTPESYGHNYKYLTIREADGSYSAHRIYLTVRSVSLAPNIRDENRIITAVSYQTVFKCNDVAAQYVTAYGAKFTGDTAVYANYMAEGSYTLTGENLGTAWLTSTLKTTNTAQVNAANAVAAPTVSAYITLSDGLAEEVSSAGVTRSLKDMIVYANGLTDLTAVQKAALGAMYNRFKAVLDAWTDVDLSAIKHYGA